MSEEKKAEGKTHGEGVQGAPKWLWYIVGGIIVIILLSGLFRSCNNNSKKPKTEIAPKNTNSSSQGKWEIEKTVTVKFGGEYGEVYKGVRPGSNVSFENATEDYCAKNKVNEYCAKKGEDVGRQMPNSTNNGELRFKSQNGKTGSIDIIFWFRK